MRIKKELFEGKNRPLLFSAALMAAAAAAVALVFLFQRNVDTAVINGGAYNYFGEQRVEFEGTCRLTYKDGVCTLKDDNGTHVLDSKPLYQSDGSFMIPQTYTWNDMESGAIWRFEHFGEARLEGQGVTLTDGGRQRENAGGFLFDGNDTYIFLESAELQAGGESVRLPALSYAVARYGSTVQYFNYGDGTSHIIEAAEGDELALLNNGVTVNLGTDTVYRANGTWYLLVVQPKLAERMK